MSGLTSRVDPSGAFDEEISSREGGGGESALIGSECKPVLAGTGEGVALAAVVSSRRSKVQGFAQIWRAVAATYAPGFRDPRPSDLEYPADKDQA